MSSTGARLIDEENGISTKLMRVLVLGHSRTGTMCMFLDITKIAASMTKNKTCNSNLYVEVEFN
jgi:hypothetical protein